MKILAVSVAAAVGLAWTSHFSAGYAQENILLHTSDFSEGTLSRLNFARGFDVVLGRIFDTPCVAFAPPGAPPQAGTTQLQASFRHSHSTSIEQGRINVGLSGGYGVFAGHLHHRSELRSEIDTRQVTFRISAEHRTEPSVITTSGLTAPARRLVDRRDFLAFRNECGTHFVGGMIFGASINVDRTFTTRSENFSRDAVTSLGVAADLFNRTQRFDGEVATRLEFASRLLEHRTSLTIRGSFTNISARSECANAAQEVASLTDFERLTRSGALIHCRVDTPPVVFAYILQPYSIVDPSIDYLVGPLDQRFATSVFKLRSRLNSLRDVIASPGAFGPLDLNVVRRQLRQFENVLSYCIESYRNFASGDDQSSVRVEWCAQLEDRIPNPLQTVRLLAPHVNRPEADDVITHPSVTEHDRYVRLVGYYTRARATPGWDCPPTCAEDTIGILIIRPARGGRDEIRIHQSAGDRDFVLPGGATLQWQPSNDVVFHDNAWAASSGLMIYTPVHNLTYFDTRP